MLKRATGRIAVSMVLAGLAVALMTSGVLADTPETNAGNFVGQPPRAITVTPDDNLAATQLVTVTGTGFAPNSPIFLNQTGGPGGIPPVLLGSTTSDASGSFGPVTVTVQRFVPSLIPLLPIADCATIPFGCIVTATDNAPGGAAHHLTFSTAAYHLAVDVPAPAAALEPPLPPVSLPSGGPTAPVAQWAAVGLAATTALGGLLLRRRRLS